MAPSFLCSNSSSFATLAAIRRASSRVSSLAAVLHCGIVSGQEPSG